MEHGYWILKDKKPVKVDTVEEWGALFENTDGRRVAQDTVGDYWISTVFLGMDHNFYDEGPPILFETMVFYRREPHPHELKGKIGDDVYQNRYATWEEAEAGHKEAVEMVKSGKIKRESE